MAVSGKAVTVRVFVSTDVKPNIVTEQSERGVFPSTIHHMNVRTSTHTFTFTSRFVRHKVCEPVVLHGCKCKCFVAVRDDGADSPVNCRIRTNSCHRVFSNPAPAYSSFPKSAFVFWAFSSRLERNALREHFPCTCSRFRVCNKRMKKIWPDFRRLLVWDRYLTLYTFGATQRSSLISIAAEDWLSAVTQNKEHPYEDAGAAGWLSTRFDAI